MHSSLSTAIRSKTWPPDEIAQRLAMLITVGDLGSSVELTMSRDGKLFDEQSSGLSPKRANPPAPVRQLC